ncbi:MAG: CBS domain-containing protein, partial [Hymenobacter sp.]
MQPPPAIVAPTDTVEHVLELLEHTATTTLPVVDADGSYAGFITKAAILARYRRELIEEGQA